MTGAAAAPRGRMRAVGRKTRAPRSGARDRNAPAETGARRRGFPRAGWSPELDCRKLSAVPSFRVRHAVKPSCPTLLAGLFFAVVSGWAADATSPVDAAQRNGPFQPGSTVNPDRRTPTEQANRSVQDKRVEPTIIDRTMAPQSGLRAAIAVQEARDKQVIERESRRPETVERTMSDYNHRNAAISTEANTSKPPTVTRYQDGLSAATTSNMARFPAVDRATNAKINRFVFRRNPGEGAAATDGAAVTPAAGGSVPVK